MPKPITDEQVITSLLTEETVQGYVIKPWTLKQLILVMPILDALIGGLKDRGIELDNLEEVFGNQGLAALKDLVQVILPKLPEFLAITLRIDRDEAEEIDLTLAMQLAVKVLAMNLEHVKNAFGLIMEQMGIMVGPTGIA